MVNINIEISKDCHTKLKMNALREGLYLNNYIQKKLEGIKPIKEEK